MRGCERLCPRHDIDNTRPHLRRRDKSSGRDVEHDLRLREPLNEDREASVRFAARRPDEALGDLTLEHQGQTRIFADPIEPTDQQRRGDIVGQVGDNLARRVRQLGRIEGQRIAGHHIEPMRINRGEFFKGRETTGVAFDCNNPASPGRQQRPCQPAGPRANLDDGCVVEWSGCAGDTAREVQVEEEMLPEDLARMEPVPSDDVAQRRERRFGRAAYQAASSRLAAMSAANRNAAIKLSGRATPRPAIANAVPWSGEVRTKGRPNVTLTPP